MMKIEREKQKYQSKSQVAMLDRLMEEKAVRPVLILFCVAGPNSEMNASLRLYESLLIVKVGLILNIQEVLMGVH